MLTVSDKKCPHIFRHKNKIFQESCKFTNSFYDCLDPPTYRGTYLGTSSQCQGHFWESVNHEPPNDDYNNIPRLE